jgi:hypothetical protein
MYIGIQYQKMTKEFNTRNFSMYILVIQYQKKIDKGIQYQKSNCLGLYLLHHFTEFLQHIM